jgi:hypothetical protein
LEQQHITSADEAPDEFTAADIAGLMVTVLNDGLDHPELWARIPDFIDAYPTLPAVLTRDA